MKRITILVLLSLLSISVHALPKLVRDPLALSPGSINVNITQDNIQQTICIPGYSTLIRPSRSYSSALKAKMLKAVRKTLPAAKSSDYEMDHVVPLSSGGNPAGLDANKQEIPNGIDNLWLQPWYSKGEQFGAYAKDRLEKKVHKDICSGKITLQQGQQIFLDGWEKEYRRLYVKPK